MSFYMTFSVADNVINTKYANFNEVENSSYK